MKKQIQLWFRVIPAAVLGIVLLVTGCRAPAPVSEPVAEVAAAPAPVVAAPVPAAGSPEGGLPQEGIQVHGRWTIEVRNPDGTVAEVRDFENALSTFGDGTISKLLGRKNSAGGWTIRLAGNAFQSTANTSIGLIIESGGLFAPSGAGIFPTLTIDVPATGTNTDKLVLSGTAIAQRDGMIEIVSTAVTTRPNTEAPSSTYGGGADFTSAWLDTPITLLAGQQVLVTVVISFS